MVKFYVDAYADMFGKELEDNGLYLAPSKIKKGRTTIDFQGFKADELEAKSADILADKYTIIPLNRDEWVEFFKKDLENGDDVIFFSIAFNMLQDKGQALLSAFEQLNTLFPDRKAILINTCTVSRGTSEIAGMVSLVYKRNKDLDASLEFAENIIGKFVSVFAIEDVNNISPNSIIKPLLDNFPGSSLNIKPIISIDTEGKLKLLDKAKGFKNAVSKLYSNTKMNGQNIADYTFSIVYFGAKDDATALYNRFRELVNESEIRLIPLSLNNAIKIGKKCVGLTFHSKY